jgi:hypothetical protein
MTTKQSVRFWLLYFGAMMHLGRGHRRPTDWDEEQRMDDGADPGGPTELTPSSGATLLVLGNVQQVGQILRVDVWVEERSPGHPSSVSR